MELKKNEHGKFVAASLVGGDSPIPVHVSWDIKVKKLHQDAQLPTREREGDSGYDLYTLEDTIVPVGMKRKLRTGLAFEIPFGLEGVVRPRSGLSADTQIDVKVGTIDSPYRGELKVTVHNTSMKNVHAEVIKTDYGVEVHPKPQDIKLMKDVKDEELKHAVYFIPAGTKIAQIVFQELPRVSLTETEGKLSETDRGSNGYGSSGV